MKKIRLLFAICILSLTSCFEDTTQLAKDEFYKYYNGNNDTVLIYNDSLFFGNYDLDLSNHHLNKDNSLFLIANNSIYFLNFNIENRYASGFDVYKCDINGENEELDFSIKIDPFKVDLFYPAIKYMHDNFYFKYERNGVEYIDQYNVSTKTYSNIEQGDNLDILKYEKEEKSNIYNIEICENKSSKKHDEFVIQKKETGEKRIIDDEYLKNTIYIESLEKYGYNPRRVDVSNDHIYLVYSYGAGDGWTYSHIVFEYDYENDLLEYKLISFTHDVLNFKIVSF